MHEFSLMADLLRKIETVAQESGPGKIIGIHVKLGALSHISGAHFQEHFEQMVPGTVAEGAQLHVEVLTDPHDPNAQDILLDSLEIAP